MTHLRCSLVGLQCNQGEWLSVYCKLFDRLTARARAPCDEIIPIDSDNDAPQALVNREAVISDLVSNLQTVSASDLTKQCVRLPFATYEHMQRPDLITTIIARDEYIDRLRSDLKVVRALRAFVQSLCFGEGMEFVEI